LYSDWPFEVLVLTFGSQIVPQVGVVMVT